jgi:NADPH-dependent 2,4-dienoyl-CoA reductase/sulfur reductase-like enzyme
VTQNPAPSGTPSGVQFPATADDDAGELDGLWDVVVVGAGPAGSSAAHL